jgi:putative NADPH-quinone reductase
MARSIVVIHGHPDPDPAHLCRALANAYAESARAAGHTVNEIDIATLDFPILRSAAEFAGPVPETLLPAFDAIKAADHILLVFPLWLGTLPALTKAFFEQVAHRNVAFEDSKDGGWPKGALSGRSARIVVTMGMPAFVYRFWYFAHGLRGFERNVLALIGIKRIRETLFGMVEGVSNEKRKAWVEHMKALGRAAS